MGDDHKVDGQPVAAGVSECADALAQAENRYQALFENSGTAMIIIEEDTTIAAVNTEFEKLSGYSRAEAIGRRSWTEVIPPEDLERMKRYHALRRKDPGAAPRNYEFQFMDRFGAMRTVYGAISLIPGTRRSVASFVDVSDRKRIEKLLRGAVLQWEAAFDALGDGMALLDAAGRIVRCNRVLPRMLGKSAGELLESRCCESIHGFLPAQETCPFERLLESRRRERVVFEREDRRLMLAADPILGEDGSLSGAVCVLTDITEIESNNQAPSSNNQGNR